MIVVYVAGPYTSKDPWQLHQNIERAKAAGRDVALAGAMPCIPHSNTPEEFCGINDYEFWIEGTMELLLRADAIYMVSGWENSNGARKEWLRAQQEYMPTVYQVTPPSFVVIDGEGWPTQDIPLVGAGGLLELAKDSMLGGVRR